MVIPPLKSNSRNNNSSLNTTFIMGCHMHFEYSWAPNGYWNFFHYEITSRVELWAFITTTTIHPKSLSILNCIMPPPLAVNDAFKAVRYDKIWTNHINITISHTILTVDCHRRAHYLHDYTSTIHLLRPVTYIIMCLAF